MKCPYCGEDNTKVLDSRTQSESSSIKRRRVCESCGKRFTTYETVGDLQIHVLKKNGNKELFSRDKIINGIMRSLIKRDIDREQIEELVSKVERDILTDYSGEIKSNVLGDIILNYLKEIDEVAYVRFASVYKKFNSLENFIKEIEKIKDKK